MNILNKFENFEIKQEDKISKEDRERCEKIQAIYEQTLSTYKKWYDIYHETKDCIEKHDFYSLELNDLSVCKNIESLHNGLISSIYSYFTAKYNIDINKNYDKENDFNYNYSNKTINTSPIDYKIYVDDILRQLNGFDFKSLRIKQLKEKIKDICKYGYGSNEWRVEIKGNTIKFNDLLYWGYLGMEIGKLLTIESALSWFEFGKETKIPEFNQIRTRYNIEWHEINPCMELSTNKIKSIKFFKNGRMDIKFSSPEIARQFISEWCGYPLVDEA